MKTGKIDSELKLLNTNLDKATDYRKVPKFLDARKLCCNHPKTGKKTFYHRVKHPKDADSIANSEDPNQTAPLGKLRTITKT